MHKTSGKKSTFCIAWQGISNEAQKPVLQLLTCVNTFLKLEKLKPFIHNVEKWAKIHRFLKNVWPYFSIMNEDVYGNSFLKSCDSIRQYRQIFRF